MKLITFTDYESINSFRQQIEVSFLNKCVFYRGTKVNFLLPPIVPSNNKLNYVQLERIEEKLLNEFKFYYTEIISEGNNVTNDWLFRIKGREHGLASRLMDWSNTFYKALDFATYHVKTDLQFRYVYLWILIIEREEIMPLEQYKNHPFINLNAIRFLNNAIPAKLVDLLASHRQTIQGGSFLVQPSHSIIKPINEQPYFQDKLICIKIPVENIKSIRQDIILKAGEDINKSILIEENHVMDLICKKLNNDYLYSVNEILLGDSNLEKN